MDFSFSSLMSAFIFGVIGFWLVKEGKRTANFAKLFIGLGLMVYPYFTSGPWADWGVGVALCLLAYQFKD
jgi:hypothetical protein